MIDSREGKVKRCPLGNVDVVVVHLQDARWQLRDPHAGEPRLGSFVFAIVVHVDTYGTQIDCSMAPLVAKALSIRARRAAQRCARIAPSEHVAHVLLPALIIMQFIDFIRASSAHISEKPRRAKSELPNAERVQKGRCSDP